MRRFADRSEAGKLLAERLKSYAGRRPVVLALPRGGLPVAAEIAAALRAPLDILAVKKIGAPGQPELAVGAVSEDGIPVFNEELVETLDPDRRFVVKAARAKTEEVRRQVAAYREVRPPEPVSGRTVILVDDGLATGATMEAATRVLKSRGASAVVVAVPVASSEAYWRIHGAVDEIIALERPRDFYAVGIWYGDFSEVSDDIALGLLRDQGPAAGGEPARARAAEPEPGVPGELKRLARPLSGDQDLRELAKAVGSRKIVMLGESTHGTKEFYRIRRDFTRILVEEHGFGLVAVEGDWPDCFEINRFVRGRTGKKIRTILGGFRRWPTCMWANEEVVALAEDLHERRASFYGLDVYSLHESIRVIQRYAQRLGPETASEILYRYSCFEPFERDEISYAKAVLRFPEGCRDEVRDNLRDLLRIRLEDTRLTEDELFNARMNALVIRNAESYYRAMLTGEAESWNVRDRHMLETLRTLLDTQGPAGKAIVWAHNTHVGDYRATDMLEEGYVNLGGLAREAYGEANVALVGFGTYGGSVRAGRAWGAPDEEMRLPDAREGSLEADCHRYARERGHDRFYLLFDEASRHGAFGRRQGHRAVGVVYSPAYERGGHNYVPTELAKRYDAFVFVDRTGAIDSLRPPAEHGLFPETWPSGT